MMIKTRQGNITQQKDKATQLARNSYFQRKNWVSQVALALDLGSNNIVINALWPQHTYIHVHAYA